MFKIDLEGFKETADQLQDYARKGENMALKLLRKIATSYKGFIKKNYLKGQYLNRRSGKAIKKLRAKKTGKMEYTISEGGGIANIYEHAGGVFIRPKEKRALYFKALDGSDVFIRGEVHLKQRPFISDSFHSFNFNTAMEKASEDMIERYKERDKAE